MTPARPDSSGRLGSSRRTARKYGLSGPSPFVAWFQTQAATTPPGAGDAGHLAQAGDRVGHEVDDELGERGVELAVVERELLRARVLDPHARLPTADGGDEALGGVDGGDRFRAEPLDELGGQRPGPAPDVECALSRLHAGEVGELRREVPRVPAHEAVVGIRRHLEVRLLRHREHLNRPATLLNPGIQAGRLD